MLRAEQTSTWLVSALEQNTRRDLTREQKGLVHTAQQKPTTVHVGPLAPAASQPIVSNTRWDSSACILAGLVLVHVQY